MIQIKYIKCFFGLGFGVERLSILPDNCDWRHPINHWHMKIYLGPYIVMIEPEIKQDKIKKHVRKHGLVKQKKEK